MIYMEEKWINLEFIGASSYEVSNTGKVRNVKTGKLANYRDNRGYKRVQVYISKKLRKPNQPRLKECYVHRIVAMAFLPNLNNYPEVDHIDGNKSNNDVSNLRWITKKDNMNNHITKRQAGFKWMTNGNDNMQVFPPWEKDMLIFGWWYGITQRKKK